MIRQPLSRLKYSAQDSHGQADIQVAGGKMANRDFIQGPEMYKSNGKIISRCDRLQQEDVLEEEDEEAEQNFTIALYRKKQSQQRSSCRNFIRTKETVVRSRALANFRSELRKRPSAAVLSSFYHRSRDFNAIQRPTGHSSEYSSFYHLYVSDCRASHRTPV